MLVFLSITVLLFQGCDIWTGAYASNCNLVIENDSESAILFYDLDLTNRFIEKNFDQDSLGRFIPKKEANNIVLIDSLWLRSINSTLFDTMRKTRNYLLQKEKGSYYTFLSRKNYTASSSKVYTLFLKTEIKPSDQEMLGEDMYKKENLTLVPLSFEKLKASSFVYTFR